MVYLFQLIEIEIASQHCLRKWTISTFLQSPATSVSSVYHQRRSTGTLEEETPTCIVVKKGDNGCWLVRFCCSIGGSRVSAYKGGWWFNPRLLGLHIEVSLGNTEPQISPDDCSSGVWVCVCVWDPDEQVDTFWKTSPIFSEYNKGKLAQNLGMWQQNMLLVVVVKTRRALYKCSPFTMNHLIA